MLNVLRYNGIWARDIQNVILSILICGWLGGMSMQGKPAEQGKLFTIEEVGEILNGESPRQGHLCRSILLNTGIVESLG